MTAYDTNNIFAKILRGEIPSHRVYEDEHTVAFMDVMPQANGHTLVIPKAPSRNILDADPETLSRLLPVVQKVAVAAKEAFEADGVTVIQFNEPAAGQTVYHLHVHIIPRIEGVALKPHSGTMEDQGVLAANAEKLKAALAKGGSDPENGKTRGQETDGRGDAGDLPEATAEEEADRADDHGPQPQPERRGLQRAGREEDQLGDDRGNQRGRHRLHPVQHLRFLVDAIAGEHARPAPEIGREPSGDGDEDIGPKAIETHERASRRRSIRSPHQASVPPITPASRISYCGATMAKNQPSASPMPSAQ